MVDLRYPIEAGMFAGIHEPELFELMRRVIAPGAVCVDVGANVGAVTLGMAELVGNSGRVVAFEPGPLLFDRLLANLQMNPEISPRVTAAQLGLSERPGCLIWKEDPTVPGNAHLHHAQHAEGIAVPVTTIDAYFCEFPIPRLDFVKIDVESMEKEVLHGGRNTWRKYRPIIFFETLPSVRESRGDQHFPGIEAFLADLGFALCKPGKAGSLTPTTADDLDLNTVAVPRERLGSLLNLAA